MAKSTLPPMMLITRSLTHAGTSTTFKRFPSACFSSRYFACRVGQSAMFSFDRTSPIHAWEPCFVASFQNSKARAATPKDLHDILCSADDAVVLSIR